MANDDDAHHPPPETTASSPSSTTALNSATKAPKDRSCPFCGQAFTSSSLGRHLDLYIKPKNPKPPDGVHDVDEIKRIRSAITRRQPRSNVKAGSGNPVNSRPDINGLAVQSVESGGDTPSRHNASNVDDGATAAAEKRDDHRMYTMLNTPVWQATGVINNLPPRAPSRGNAEPTTGQAHRINEMRRDPDGQKVQRPDYDAENVSRLQEAAELGRAAEMALREVLGSLEAAQQKLDPRTPFASGESWTLGPPELRQYDTMARYVNERFNARRKADGIPDAVSFKHHSHLSGAWEHWQALPESDRDSAWHLEILRSFTRSQEQKKDMRAELEAAQQHARHLEAEYDRLSRCQLPREYLLHPPNTVPVSKEVMREVRSAPIKPAAADMNYNAEALISKWRSQIRATTRPSRVAPPPPPKATPGYDPTEKRHRDEHALQAEMVMTGSVWGINGPMPRRANVLSLKHQISQDIDYETPREPGGIVGADDDDDHDEDDNDDNDDHGDVDMDADGEADEVTTQHSRQPYRPNALIRRQHQANLSGGRSPAGYNASMRSVMNSNGKRPSSPPSISIGTESYKVYKERHAPIDDQPGERTPY